LSFSCPKFGFPSLFIDALMSFASPGRLTSPLPNSPLSDNEKGVVLLATYNGSAYIDDQILSILGQVGVDVSVVVSDDFSTDMTLRCLRSLVSAYPDRVDLFYGCRQPELMERSSASNFYYLISSIELSSDIGWVALSDQDDLWHPDRLARALACIVDFSLAGYSSSVMAFWSNGEKCLVKKNGAITKYNHLFEAPGPGCSFVLPRDSFLQLQAHLRTHLASASRIHFHDWAIYAYIRSLGGRWYIDPWPSLMYRQHDSNVLGVQLTTYSISRRLSMLLGGWYRAQCLAIAQFVGQSSDEPAQLLRRFSFLDRVRLALMIVAHRRRSRDKFLLPFAFLCMIPGRLRGES